MRRKEREISDTKVIDSIILSADVCRIALAENNYPYLVTMNFGYSSINRRELYFHCSGEGKKLDMIRKNNYVCFEFDTDHRLYEGPAACDFGMSFQSVVGYGSMTIITDPEEKKKGLDIIMEHYTGKNDFLYRPEALEKTVILRLDISEMTGKKC